MPEDNGTYVVDRGALLDRVDAVAAQRQVVAPVTLRGVTHFRAVRSQEQIQWDYNITQLPPSKVIYGSRREMVRFTRDGDGCHTEVVEPNPEPRVLFGVHPCDLHGMLVIERTLLGESRDPWYEARREATLVVGLNCQSVGPLCFCASYGTGPFYHRWMDQGPPEGCDLLLTELGEQFLADVMTEQGREFLGDVERSPASPDHMERKEGLEHQARDRFTRSLQTEGLPELLMGNLDHPVWARVGEGRCLSCTNCTMVCPTCYCYDILEQGNLDLEELVRYRQWDSCQDQHFAEVHFGNYRSTRAARLRQFVCHKLSYWVPQHGCFGCVGCGRCIHWCPTGIDLTAIATEIREDAEAP